MGTNAEYVAVMQAQMTKWDAAVAALLADGRKANGEARTAYARRLKELRLARKSAQRSLDQLGAATDSAGTQLQAGMQATWDAMQVALGKASSDLGQMAGQGRARHQQEAVT